MDCSQVADAPSHSITMALHSSTRRASSLSDTWKSKYLRRKHQAPERACKCAPRDGTTAAFRVTERRAKRAVADFRCDELAGSGRSIRPRGADLSDSRAAASVG